MFDVVGQFVIYYKNKEIREYNVANCSDGVIAKVKLKPLGEFSSAIDSPPKNILVNPSKKSLFLINYPPKKFDVLKRDENDDTKYSIQTVDGYNAVWVSRTLYCFFGEAYKTLYVRDISSSRDNGNEIKIQAPYSTKIFQATPGTVFLTSNSMIYHFDVMRQSVLAYRPLENVSRIYLSPSSKTLCCLSSDDDFITFCSITMDRTHQIEENSKVFGGFWYKDIAFIYATNSHIKYCNEKGDKGILKGISKPYIPLFFEEKNNMNDPIFKLNVINIENKIELIDIDLSECLFKYYLNLSNNPRCQQKALFFFNQTTHSATLMKYLEEKNFLDICLQNLDDDEKKFEIALTTKNIAALCDIAEKMKDKDKWKEIANLAMEQGKFSIVEKCLIKAEDFEGLSFFYLISGQGTKLDSVCQRDSTLLLQKSIWTNDSETECQILWEASPTLAYLASLQNENTEYSKGFDIDDTTKQKLQEYVPKTHKLKRITLPDNVGVDDWSSKIVENAETPNDHQHEISDEHHKENRIEDHVDNEEEDDDWMIDDNDSDQINSSTSMKQESNWAIPPKDSSIEERILEKGCNNPGQLVACGFFGEAIQELSSQICLINAKPLKDLFVTQYIGSHLSVETNNSNLIVPLTQTINSRQYLINCFTLDSLKEQIQVGYDEFKKGKFELSKETFLQILYKILLLTLVSRDEEKEALRLIEVCRNYIIGTSLGKESHALKGKDDKKQLELAIFFALGCELEESHQRLALTNAMMIAAKNKCNKIAFELSQKLSNYDRDNKKAKTILANYQSNPTDAFDININMRRQFEVCSLTKTPIYKGSKKLVCSFCGASYTFQNEFKGKLCPICNLSSIGTNPTGLILIP